MPLRPLDDDEDEDHKEALVRSFHAYGQSRCDMLSSAGDGAIAMTRGKGVVGSAPSLVGTCTTMTRQEATAVYDDVAQLIGRGLHPAVGAPASTLLFCALHRHLLSR